MRYLARLLLLPLFLIPNTTRDDLHEIVLNIPETDGHMIGKYDSIIQAATDKHLPTGYDWRLFKAQLWQESKMDPHAKSPVGALGIPQFMPATWGEWAPKAGYPKAARTDPEASIFTAAMYMANLIDGWYWERPDADRYCLAMASFNAGFGNLLKAQKRVGGKALYADIISGLPQVTGFNSLETINYVRKILDYCAGQVTGEYFND